MQSGRTHASSIAELGLCVSPPQPKELDKLMQDSILIEQDDRATGDLLSSLFKEGAMDPTSLPEHPCPPGRKDGTMRTNLLPFQKQGLAWMIKMEHPRLPMTEEGAPVQLWRKKLDVKVSLVSLDQLWFESCTDFVVVGAGRPVLAQYRHRRHPAREASPQAGRSSGRRDG